MKDELMLNGFSVVTENELLEVDGGLSTTQWITGACAFAGLVIGTAIGGPVCGFVGVKVSSVVGTTICVGIGAVTSAVAGAVGHAICSK